MPHASDCDCILLAAGLSSRMKGTKMLREIDGRPLIQIAVGNALAACRRVILVLGHEAEAVRRAAGSSAQGSRGPGRLTPVENPFFRDGMFGSIQTGMRWVGSEWFFVVPGDMPGITPNLYEAIGNAAPAAREHESVRSLVPYYGPTRGHPVLIHRSLIDSLLSEPRSAGPMRDLIARYPVHRVQIDDPAVTLDVDTDADYRRVTDG